MILENIKIASETLGHEIGAKRTILVSRKNKQASKDRLQLNSLDS